MSECIIFYSHRSGILSGNFGVDGGGLLGEGFVRIVFMEGGRQDVTLMPTGSRPHGFCSGERKPLAGNSQRNTIKTVYSFCFRIYDIKNCVFDQEVKGHLEGSGLGVRDPHPCLTDTASLFAQQRQGSREIAKLQVLVSLFEGLHQPVTWRGHLLRIPGDMLRHGTNQLYIHFVNAYALAEGGGLRCCLLGEEGGPFFCTMLQPFEGRTLLPCIDSQNGKMTVQLTVAAPPGLTVVSNEPLAAMYGDLTAYSVEAQQPFGCCESLPPSILDELPRWGPNRLADSLSLEKASAFCFPDFGALLGGP
ncbi:hypothetical protein cyc_06438 [Cyclospora cayetanensis]|uniref:Uncharacterized protein n=1 Tax=Cyclospora cayetanensis TaxID=88456 RepID=A0A1D3D655_9EIME|nr:hypothetical protein cyc_06438 [Cyclospora cayetanensis]